MKSNRDGQPSSMGRHTTNSVAYQTQFDTLVSAVNLLAFSLIGIAAALSGSLVFKPTLIVRYLAISALALFLAVTAAGGLLAKTIDTNFKKGEQMLQMQLAAQHDGRLCEISCIGSSVLVPDRVAFHIPGDGSVLRLAHGSLPNTGYASPKSVPSGSLCFAWG